MKMEQQNYSAFAEVTLLINYLCANSHGRPFVLIDGLYIIINVNNTTSKILFSDKLQKAMRGSTHPFFNQISIWVGVHSYFGF